MPYNFVANSTHRKKLCSRLSLSEVHFTQKTAVLRFLAPPPVGGLEATYDVHLRLIGKRVVDLIPISVN